MGLYEFDSFRFDPRTGLLLRGGREIRLSKQTADLLTQLVDRPGQILLKEELISAVWPGTSVEDSSLTFAIHQLRTALGRREDGTRYIETLPKRGYRFLVTVNKIRPELVQGFPRVPRVQESADEKIQYTEPESLPEQPPHFLPSRRLAGFTLMGALLLLGLAVAISKWNLDPNPRLSVASYSQLTNNGRDKGELFTDGVRVYFLEQEPEGPRLASIAVEGGGAGVLPVPIHDTYIFDIAPLRSEVLVGRKGSERDSLGLWVISLLGGPSRSVGELNATSAIWSHDKTQIAYILGSGLFIATSDGTGARKIANLPEGAHRLRWSPDEKTLRFDRIEYRNGDSQLSIWEVQLDGTSVHQLLPGWNASPHECCGIWTPDGSFYIFQSKQKDHTDLWAIPEQHTLFGKADTAPFRLSSAPLDLSQPTISGDEKHVFAIGIQARGEVVRYDSGLHDFVKFLGGISATWVTFSKSGRLVAYINYPDRTIWRANADGSGKSQLTFAPLQADGLSWSPDEKWLAVRARTPGNAWRIYLVSLQEREAQPIMSGESEQGIASWSPDGRRLCFGDVPAVFGRAVGTEAIHIFDLRTRKVSDLPGSHVMWTCRWSPDGRYIAALTIGGQRLKIFDFSTNTWRSSNAAHVNTPNWSTDSECIYYDTEPNNRTLRRVHIGDGKVEQLADLRNFRGFADWWSGLSPKNEPLLLRNLGSTEIYSLSLESK